MTQVCAAVFLCAGLACSIPVLAEENASTLIGRQTVGVVMGGMLPVRIMEAQSSKLNGVAVHPSWQITLTDPIGDGWWRGSVALGLEAVFLGIAEPTGTYGVGVTPKVVYTLTSFGGSSRMSKVEAAHSGRISMAAFPNKDRISIFWSGAARVRAMI